MSPCARFVKMISSLTRSFRWGLFQAAWIQLHLLVLRKSSESSNENDTIFLVFFNCTSSLPKLVFDKQTATWIRVLLSAVARRTQFNSAWFWGGHFADLFKLSIRIKEYLSGRYAEDKCVSPIQERSNSITMNLLLHHPVWYAVVFQSY